jgi:hypothetical protein
MPRLAAALRTSASSNTSAPSAFNRRAAVRSVSDAAAHAISRASDGANQRFAACRVQGIKARPPSPSTTNAQRQTTSSGRVRTASHLCQDADGKPESRFLRSIARAQDLIDDRLNVSLQPNEQIRIVRVTAFDLAIPTWIVNDASDNLVDSYSAQGRTVAIAPTAAEHFERGLRRASSQCQVSSSVASLADRSCFRA